MTAGLYVGSFDPFTNGHLDIIKRSLAFCDKLHVVVGVNIAKKTMFTAEERVSLIDKVIQLDSSIKDPTRVVITSHTGLIADYAKKLGVSVFIRGVRSVADYEYESNWTLINKKLVPNIETVFLLSDPDLSVVSSSVVKELLKFNASVSQFVPGVVEAALLEKIKVG